MDTPATPSIRVLIVDDDQDLRGLLKAYLEGPGKCEVVGEAGDGEDGVRLAGELAPDVVVLDLKMPGLNGLDALPEVRRVAPEARILVFSSGSRADRDLALERGADGFRRKDDSMRDVVRDVRALAGRA